MYKSNIGDYPLKVHPCKWWFVRYAVACTRESELHDKEMWEKLREAGFTSTMYGVRKGDVTYWENKQEKLLDRESEAYKIIMEYTSSSPEWVDCPYEDDDQSKCPHYEPSGFYKDVPLVELRKRKGYNV